MLFLTRQEMLGLHQPEKDTHCLGRLESRRQDRCVINGHSTSAADKTVLISQQRYLDQARIRQHPRGKFRHDTSRCSSSGFIAEPTRPSRRAWWSPGTGHGIRIRKCRVLIPCPNWPAIKTPRPTANMVVEVQRPASLSASPDGIYLSSCPLSLARRPVTLGLLITCSVFTDGSHKSKANNAIQPIDAASENQPVPPGYTAVVSTEEANRGLFLGPLQFARY